MQLRFSHLALLSLIAIRPIRAITLLKKRGGSSALNLLLDHWGVPLFYTTGMSGVNYVQPLIECKLVGHKRRDTYYITENGRRLLNALGNEWWRWPVSFSIEEGKITNLVYAPLWVQEKLENESLGNLSGGRSESGNRPT